MFTNADQLFIPCTFPGISQLHDWETKTLDSQRLLEVSCTSAQLSCLTSWGVPSALSVGLGAEETVMRGAIFGCKDGSLFIFHGTQAIFPKVLTDLTVRSRVVSGVTAEQVEAPRTHVDFDEEEAGKLKEMLKRKPGKEKAIPERTPANSPTQTESAVPLALRSELEPDLQKKGSQNSLLSATNSPNFTLRSISGPASSSTTPLDSHESHSFVLRCHVVPPHCGRGQSVTGLQLLDSNAMVAVLQDTGYLSVFKVIDGTSVAMTRVQDIHLQPPVGMKDREPSHDVWIWKRLLSIDLGESVMLFACAIVDTATMVATLDPSDNETQEKTHLTVFEFARNDVGESRLDKVGEWYLDGNPEGFELYPINEKSLMFFHLSAQGHLIEQRLELLPRFQPQLPEARSAEEHARLPHLANPFKQSKSPPAITIHAHEPGRIALTEETTIAEVLIPSGELGLRLRDVKGKLRGTAWTGETLLAFELHEKFFQSLFSMPAGEIRAVTWTADDTFAVAYSDKVEFHRLEFTTNNEVEGNHQSPQNISARPRLVRTVKCDAHETLRLTSSPEAILTTIESGSRPELRAYNTNTISGDVKGRTLWKAPRETSSISSPAPRLTSLLPLELNLIVLGYNDGYIRKSSFYKIACHALVENTCDLPLNGSIISLHQVQNDHTKERYIVGGADDGTIAFWELSSLKLCARWTLFLEPLCNVAQFDETGLLKDCLLCCSHDGTIAVISVDGLQFLYLIPGSHAMLESIYRSESNLLLMYSDDRARLWDIKTRVFWRSMASDKAKELLHHGGWLEAIPGGRTCLRDTSQNFLTHSQALDAASTILIDVCKILTDPASTKFGKEEEQRRSVIENLRALLSVLLTPGLSEEIDGICQKELRIPLSTGSIGVFHRSASLYNRKKARDLWCISPYVSAVCTLSIVSALRAYGLVEDCMDHCNTVISFYATSLRNFIGQGYRPPDLAYLARCWLNSSSEIRQAARILIDARISRLTDEEANALASRWQHHLPCIQPDVERQSVRAALALLLCGQIAAEKPSLFSTNTLTDISRSITLYLHDDNSPYRAVAIDLCPRAFQLWQNYVDVMEILRALFLLATNPRKEAISAQNLGPQARLAVLQIASNNTTLFMTTLALDILNPRSVEHRKSVMQIFAFLIRKRPLVLYPNLPRILEAVVKSLDPNSNSSREAVIETATEILVQVVKTFPNVDFHTPTQRLAVGTSEGAIVMYDVKTATRLYVLEGRKSQPAACGFSPDGRRLVTVFLEQNVVLVWKVGSSISSIFNPGAPPRQGRAGSEPFKTLTFNVGDQDLAHLPVQARLDNVHLEWTGERSVKLKIYDNVFSFST